MPCTTWRASARACWRCAPCRSASVERRPQPRLRRPSATSLGFKDGTDNLLAGDTAEIAQFVWVDDEAGAALDGRGDLPGRSPDQGPARAVGGNAARGAGGGGRPLQALGCTVGGPARARPVDLSATGAHGLPLIPDGAHIRVASPLANAGQRLLRRGYGFADGVDPVSESLDAGLFFICFQKDPALQFTAIQRRLATNDALHGYLVHTSSGVYACPRGLSPGEGWGQVVLG